jgi:putative Holliday junction resolvase
MKYLGIDYGRKKIGLALSDGVIAEPLKVIRGENEEELLKKVESSFIEALADRKVDKIIIGVSEGEMGRETREFGEKLGEKLKIPVIFQDETLSTQTAQELSISANIKRKKRKQMEDAYSAAIILQSYIDNNL